VSGSSAPTVTLLAWVVSFDVHPAVKMVPITTSATIAALQRLANGIRITVLNEVRTYKGASHSSQTDTLTSITSNVAPVNVSAELES
jgi:hypothetical protein